MNKNKAIFLDRDGTVNLDVGHLKRDEDLVLLDGVSQAIRLINESSYLCIVITNQPVIARGECSFADVDRFHSIIESRIGLEGAYFDRIYYCPHHPDAGFAFERPELKIICKCRKPDIDLLLRAGTDFNIDFSINYIYYCIKHLNTV